MFDLRGQDDVERALARAPSSARYAREALSRCKVPERRAVERDIDLLKSVSQQEGDSLAYLSAAKAAGRKELPWTRMSSEDKQAFEKAAEKHWAQWSDNEAVEEVVGKDVAAIWARLIAEEQEDCVMKLRWGLTDKAAALRTEDSPLPVEDSARLVLPGYKDRDTLEGHLRRDAPTGSRLAQHILFIWAASHPDWHLISADVRAAFLNGGPLHEPRALRRAPGGRTASQSLEEL